MDELVDVYRAISLSDILVPIIASSLSEEQINELLEHAGEPIPTVVTAESSVDGSVLDELLDIID
jgi:hypothetical protein